MKKWIALLLCAVMVLGMAACGNRGGSDETEGTTVPPTQTSQEPEETTAPEETTEPAGWADELNNGAASQIPDPDLWGWEDWNVEAENGGNDCTVVGYPEVTEVDDSNRYYIGELVREKVLELVQALKEQGFTVNAVETDSGEVQMDKETWIPGDYTFTAENAAGYRCTVKAVSGEAGITLTIEPIGE